MKQILDEYVITKNTLALVPVKHLDYYTKVITTSGVIYVKKTPLQIIKHSCLEDFMTYEGRREAVKRITSYKNNVPILVNSGNSLFAFPTISPSDPDCAWIIYHHIKKIENNPKQKEKGAKAKSIIHFFNGMSMEVGISLNRLENQLYRTSMCKNIYDQKVSNQDAE